MRGPSPNPYQIESWIYRYSPLLHYTIHPKLKYERIRFPKYYAKMYLGTNVYAMHLRSVKPPLRLLERRYQTSWVSEKNKEKYSHSFKEYFKTCLKSDFGIEDLSKIVQISYDNLKDKLIPYKKEIYGDYPEILKNYVKTKFDIKL